MRKFAYINVSTTDEAVVTLRRYGGKASIITGSTDLLGTMKDEMLPTYPEVLVNSRPFRV